MTSTKLVLAIGLLASIALIVTFNPGMLSSVGLKTSGELSSRELALPYLFIILGFVLNPLLSALIIPTYK